MNNLICASSVWVGGEMLNEQINLERPIFRNLKIANVKSYEVQLFDFFIHEIFF